MTDQPQPRKHLARSIVRGKSVDLRCACGNWEITQGTQKEKRAAHRAHRVEMGETVKPRKPTLVEQLAAEVRRLTAELQQARQQTAARIATEIRQYCPDHGEADTCRIDCHCEIADEITRPAAVSGA